MERLIVIRDPKDLPALIEYLDNFDFVAVDTETTGLSKDSLVIGYSVAAELDVGYYIILREWKEGKLIDLPTLENTPEMMRYLQTKKLIMHNAPFDCAMINNNFKVELIDFVHTDTLILAHLLDENRHNGLKELGVHFFGEDVKKEQEEMKASVSKNGGCLTRDNYELYKADSELIARYGAKDTILTIKIFYHLIPELYEQGLDKFFYEEESMPLLRGPTYQLNNTGLKIDPDKLQALKVSLEAECLEAKAFIYKEIQPLVKDKYPGTGKTNVFNVGSSKQLSWLMFARINNDFHLLTKEGKELCNYFNLKLPYALKDKREFIRTCEASKGREWKKSVWNPKTKKMSPPKKVGDYWNYLACGKEALGKYSSRYKWVEKLLEYKKNLKILNTYVEGIQERMKYNVIRPGFKQAGTTSGRYSSNNPNFQNLPRDDKRVKSCIVSREGKVFVGADYSQLEPRVFASFSKDERLLSSFFGKDDFYSVIGMEVFNKSDCLPIKDGNPNAFGLKYKKLRDIAKVVALSATYGTTAPKMAPTIGKTIDEAQEVINTYFDTFPKVKEFMLECHAKAKQNGFVVNLYGRPRRMPEAKEIKSKYGNKDHSGLPYEIRNILNLAVNHTIQSTAASIMNRAAIRTLELIKQAAKDDDLWNEAKIVMQVHDELILEVPEELAELTVLILKHAMENTCSLPGVLLTAEPKIANNIADLK